MTHSNSSAEILETSQTDHASVKGLVSGIIEDAQTLIKQQFAMLRAEIVQEASQAAEAGKLLGMGAAFLMIGLSIVSIGFVYLLSWLLPDWPLWACWFAVGAVMAASGALIFIAGKNRLSKVTPRPEKSLNALQENLSWIANHPN